MKNPWSKAEREAKRRRAETAKELKGDMQGVWDSIFDNADLHLDPPYERHQHEQALYSEYVEETSFLQRQLKAHEQEPLFTRAREAAIKIPKKYLAYDDPPEAFNHLTYEGEAWLRRQLRDYNRETAKFWFSIVLPLVAILVSVLSLWMSLHRHCP